MLALLEIRNLAVIDYIKINLFEGINVFTGETGAGKSVIIDAVGMVLGKKTGRAIVRSGEKKAEVTALFYVNGETMKALEVLGVEPTDDGSVLIYRELSADGRGLCKVNGVLTPAAVLKSIGKYLVNIHSQQDTAELYSAERHIDILDGRAKADILPALDEYKTVYDEYLRLKSAIDGAQAEKSELLRSIDILEYQINEISALNTHVGETDELERDINTMENAEQLAVAAERARCLLAENEQSAKDSIRTCAEDFAKISDVNDTTEKIYSYLTEALDKLGEALELARDLREDTDFDEQRLNFMNERLYTIYKLSEKYRCRPDGLPALLEQLGEKLGSCTERLGTMESDGEKYAAVCADLEQKAQRLTEIRGKYARLFETELEAQLAELNMKGARFEVRIADSGSFNSKGRDSVEFFISANPGEDLKPLAKVASGGEASRIMLSLKSITAACDNVETYIFDEIDAGISGVTAEAVADKLITISHSSQVVIITHSQHIAAIADCHYLISKNTADGKTTAKAVRLDAAGRKNEIARIGSGSHLTETALTHAEELLEIWNKQKDEEL